jgi:hypothetical protein
MEKLTGEDLDNAQRLLDSKGPGAMYDFLSAKGYKYATLANGVAKGNSVAGAVAINFIMQTASASGVHLSPEIIDKLKFTLAGAYLGKLREKFEKYGVVDIDINYIEGWGIHNDALPMYGVVPEGWTLYAVFSVMKPESRESYWGVVLDSAGNVQKELELAVQTDRMMSTASVIGPEENRKLAKSWIDRVDSPSGTWTVLSSVISQMKNAALELFGEPETATDTPPDNLIQIEITPDPQPQQKIPGENQAREDVSNGFTQNASTHRVFFTDQTLNNTDFTSV